MPMGPMRKASGHVPRVPAYKRRTGLRRFNEPNRRIQQTHFLMA
jgi:hypothetical protein